MSEHDQRTREVIALHLDPPAFSAEVRNRPRSTPFLAAAINVQLDVRQAKARDNATAILAALTSAGLAIVPREATAATQADGELARVNGATWAEVWQAMVQAGEGGE